MRNPLPTLLFALGTACADSSWLASPTGNWTSGMVPSGAYTELYLRDYPAAFGPLRGSDAINGTGVHSCGLFVCENTFTVTGTRVGSTIALTFRFPSGTAWTFTATVSDSALVGALNGNEAVFHRLQ